MGLPPRATHALSLGLIAGVLSLPPALARAQGTSGPTPLPILTPALETRPAGTPQAARPLPVCGLLAVGAPGSSPLVPLSGPGPGAGSLAAPPAPAIRPTPAPTARPVSTRDPAATATSGTSAAPVGTALPRSPTAVQDATPRPATLATVQTLRGLSRELVAELFRIDQQLVSTASALRQAEAELVQFTAETQALEAELAVKQAAVEARGAVYGVRLRAIYKFGRTSPLEEILSARDFGDALRRITMLQSVARIDNRLLGQLRAERDAILDTTTRLRDKQRAATELRDQIDQQHQTLITQYEQQAAVVRQAQEEQSQAELALAAQQSSALAGSI
ncbi:MAG: hypothetical protein M3442_19030, partial [Chloroflexota bacterium]|nr:hypothetical protein [Chloroflexota bacterium]